jgi:hypothetical protein
MDERHAQTAGNVMMYLESLLELSVPIAVLVIAVVAIGRQL